eukprot:CAMPEP_0201285690 /NCGR_PEP_ID=MMETSP1317-20130820/113699_1 /ASSEMBLY_ACC=CAM_ASM_000770 /TAXON_ID=187299 /ORGANISM="Undescribed Undescribed, Strain Undescribed" /LENGTH=51 /DNA_ID=CAMNT_0047611487 /DNA_START=2177 /DNA_END=2332 /DNA_ORIENTATION=-
MSYDNEPYEYTATMVGAGGRRKDTNSETITVLPIPGEVWINKDFDGEIFSN